MHRLRLNLPALSRVLVPLAICLFASSAAQAAAPAAKPKPKPLSGYALNVMDEVDLQNLTCDQLRVFLNKPLDATLVQAAEDLLDQVQNTNETSLTLFGPRLNNLILQSSGEWPQCRKIVPASNAKYNLDPSVCSGPAGMVGDISNLGMGQLAEIPFHRPGEMQVLGEFSSAAKLKNCRF